MLRMEVWSEENEKKFGELLDLGHAMNWWLGGARYDEVVGAWGFSKSSGSWKGTAGIRGSFFCLRVALSPNELRLPPNSAFAACESLAVTTYRMLAKCPARLSCDDRSGAVE